MGSPNESFRNRRAAGVQLASAISALELQRPIVVVGLPRGGIPVAYVGSNDAAELVAHEVEAVVILKRPANLRAINQWYQDFDPVQDSEVRSLLENSHADTSAAARPSANPVAMGPAL